MKSTRDEFLAHEQARTLAAEALDGPLTSPEAAWLESHLAACEDCRGVAEEYLAIHLELAGLAMPEPPRDLWARTRAALDAVDSSAHRPNARPRTFQSRSSLIGSSVAVAVVVLVAGASLLGQTPISRPVPGTGGLGPTTPSSSGLTPADNSTSPLAVVNGTSYWISGENGVYQIKGGVSGCDPGDSSCTVSDGGGQTLGTIASDATVSAALAPNASLAAVWTTDKVAILPLTDAGATVSLDLLTPQPTIAATTAPTPSPTPVPTPSATAAATPTPTPVATPIATPTARSGASQSPSQPLSSPAAVTPVPSPTATPTLTPVPATPTPTVKPTPAPSSNGALAILSGFEIVGPDPEFSPDGKIVAFSARPSDHSTGPDVFIWHAGDRQAYPITSGHSDLFSGWYGTRIMISQISTSGPSEGTASPPPSSVVSTAYVFDPATGQESRIVRPMLMPVIDPSGQFVVYWSGTVEFDPTTGLWQPGAGDLYLDKWSNLVLEPVGPSQETASPGPIKTDAPGSTSSPSPRRIAEPCDD